MHLPLGARLGKRTAPLILLAALALYTGFPQPAKADFIGYYDLGNWSLTNTDYFFNAGTNGFATTPDGGLSVILTGGQSGSDFGGETDLLIQAAGSGQVSFNWSYSSLDDPGNDFAYYYTPLGGYSLLSMTGGESSLGTPVQFSVNAGDVFGFVVATADNIAEPGVLRVTDFSAPTSNASPVPEPSTTAILLTAGLAAGLSQKVRAKLSQGGQA